MTIEIKTSSSTSSFQKESGDKFVYSIDPKTKKAKTIVEVFNVFGMGSWNVVLRGQNGQWISRKVLKANLTKSQAFKFAKAYVSKN